MCELHPSFRKPAFAPSVHISISFFYIENHLTPRWQREIVAITDVRTIGGVANDLSTQVTHLALTAWYHSHFFYSLSLLVATISPLSNTFQASRMGCRRRSCYKHTSEITKYQSLEGPAISCSGKGRRSAGQVFPHGYDRSGRRIPVQEFPYL